MKAMIAMSGGVDSSVAAYLMKEAGYDCAGVTMRLYRNEDLGRGAYSTCCSQKDIDDAADVAFRLDIDYRVVDYTADFKEAVIEKFIRTYERGGTPNPCIDCNRHLKFDKLFSFAEEEGFDVIATGHYARVFCDEASGRWLLKKALDERKDQSYVLYMLPPERLKKIRFPLGELDKDSVRSIASEHGFVNAAKRDSQDICFVPDGDYVRFMEDYTGKTYREGDFIDIHGNVVGRHRGAVRYTVGQRRGLGIAAARPLYVAAIDAEKNTVTVGFREALLKQTVYAEEVNLISVDDLSEPIRVKARLRYNQKEQPAVAVMENGRLAVTFDEPQSGVANGQSLVLYDGDIVVGGGTICASR